MNLSWLFSLIVPIFKVAMELLSPEIRELVESLVVKLEEKAAATSNKFDDEFVKMLKVVLNME